MSYFLFSKFGWPISCFHPCDYSNYPSRPNWYIISFLKETLPYIFSFLSSPKHSPFEHLIGAVLEHYHRMPVFFSGYNVEVIVTNLKLIITLISLIIFQIINLSMAETHVFLKSCGGDSWSNKKLGDWWVYNW